MISDGFSFKTSPSLFFERRCFLYLFFIAGSPYGVQQKGNAFSLMFCSAHRGCPHEAIIHDALELTVQGPCSVGIRDKNRSFSPRPPPPPTSVQASDFIWWSLLDVMLKPFQLRTHPVWRSQCYWYLDGWRYIQLSSRWHAHIQLK